MVSEGKKGGRRSRGNRPNLVVPGEDREQEQDSGLLLPVRRDAVEDRVLTERPVARGREEARPVGEVIVGRRKFSYKDPTVPVNMKMDSAVHFALRLLVFETQMDQQYLINLAVRNFCREHGIDPEAVREGKGYMVSFPGGGGPGDGDTGDD